MNLENLKYDAFISYRHVDPDQFVAENLHKQLEAFRLPKNIVKKLSPDKKNKITRVFRDQEELPLASNLADPITNALQSSDFLIVICSPRLSESLWCNKEIDTFIEMHGRSRILAVLAEGEPAKSFPEQLLFKEEKTVLPNGQIKLERIPVEPLAADVRGCNKKEIFKNIKQELLRLTAPMFDLSYDDLKQRHREQKIRRMITASLAVSTICLAFGTFSTSLALRIHKQSKEIEQQSREISAQSEEITAQYNQALITRSKSLANTSLRLLEEGDRIQAMLVAREALPKDPDQPDIPYTADAAYALTEASLLYKNDEQILPIHVLDHDAQVNFSILSPEGDRILTVDTFGNLSVWDALSGEKLWESLLESSHSSYSDQMVAFLNNNLVIYPTTTGIGIYDLVQKSTLTEIPDIFYTSLACDSKGTLIAAVNGRSVYVLSSKDGSLINEYTLPDTIPFAGMLTFSPDGSMLAISGNQGLSDSQQENHLIVINPVTGQLLHDYKAPSPSIGKILFSGNSLFAIVNEEINLGSYDLYTDGGICSFDLNTKSKMNWFYKTKEQILSDFSFLETAGENYIVCNSYDTLRVLNQEDGSIISEISFEREIINYSPLTDGKGVFLVTGNGEYHVLYIEKSKRIQDYVLPYIFTCNSDNVKNFHFGDGFYASLPYASTQITVYDKAKGSGYQKLAPIEGNLVDVDANDSETTLLIAASNEVTLFDLAKKKPLKVLPFDSLVIGASFVEDGSHYFTVAASDKLYLYDAATFELVREAPLDKNYYQFHSFDANKTYAVFHSYDEFSVYDLTKGELLNQVKLDSGTKQTNVFAVSNKKDLYATASTISKELILNQIDSQTATLRIPLRAGQVSYMNFDASDELLYITYRDGKVEAYDTNDLSLSKSYTSLSDETVSILSPKDADYSILIGGSDSYLMDQDKNISAHIDGLIEVLPKSKEFILLSGQTLATVPVYDIKEILKETELQLENKTLSKAQKQELYIE